MNSLHFQTSELGTVGVELELQIVDPNSLDLCDGILPIMQRVQDSEFVRPESFQASVEIGSRVCQSAAEVDEHLVEVGTVVRAETARIGMLLCGAGTHPFSRRLATVTPRPRYLQLSGLMGFLSRMQQTFATHVHVGVRSGDEAIKVMRALRSYLPVLLALSANSPFWRGHDTNCASYRQRLLAAARSYGVPPNFDCWRQFCEFFYSTTHAGLFSSIKDIHWDIRPQPRLGTVEVRVMDAQSSLRRVAELAAVVRALALSAVLGPRDARLPQRLPWWIEKENYFQASCLGLEARYVYRSDGATMPLRALCEEVLERMRGIATSLGDRAYVEAAHIDLLGSPGYAQQREAYARRGTHEAVVAERVAVFERSLQGAALREPSSLELRGPESPHTN